MLHYGRARRGARAYLHQLHHDHSVARIHNCAWFPHTAPPRKPTLGVPEGTLHPLTPPHPLFF